MPDVVCDANKIDIRTGEYQWTKKPLDAKIFLRESG